MSNTSPADAIRSTMLLLRQGRIAESEHAFREILKQRPASSEALHGLSQALLAQKRFDEALTAIRQAIAIAPADPLVRYTHGLMLEDAGQTPAAVVEYQEACRLKPDFYQAWNNLGLALEAGRRFEQAMAAYQQALLINGRYALAHSNLGRLFLAAHQPERAVWHLGQALTLDGQKTDNHGLYALYGKALQLACSDAEAANRDAAIHLALLRKLVQFSTFIGEPAAAMATAQEIVLRYPGNWQARLARKRILPAIPTSCEVIDQSRTLYEAGLDDLLADITDPDIPCDSANVLAAARGDSFFHLAYQGKDDRPLQEKLSRVWAGLLARLIPDCQAAIPHRSPGAGPIRVGFIGSHFRQSTIGSYFSSWVTSLDPARFSVLVFLLDQSLDDDLTEEVRHKVGQVLRLDGNLFEDARTVRNAGLDVLIYPELGMDNLAYVMASLRLAPTQCAAWGHPVTSGHATIDYYFSSEWMEPPEAQIHYSEKLVTLPGLGTCYTPAPLPTSVTRQDLGLPPDGALFFFPHAPFKIHPSCDDLVARVLAETSGSHLVAVSRENPWITRAYVGRLHNAFARYGIDTSRLILLNGLRHDRYLAAAQLCSTLLDTPHWSGGNTTLDALTVGLPPVTLPGAFMRGRQTAGMLRAMGLEELVATSESDYISKAHRLATNSQLRADLSQRILSQHSRVFDDQRPLQALAAFLEEVVRKQ